MIDFNCRECGAAMDSPESRVGMPETCTACGRVTVVPLPQNPRDLRPMYRYSIIGCGLMFIGGSIAALAGLWLITVLADPLETAAECRLLVVVTMLGLLLLGLGVALDHLCILRHQQAEILVAIKTQAESPDAEE